MVLTGRSRLALLAALIGSVALMATLVLVIQPNGSGPRLDAPGNHFQVSAADTAAGPIQVAPGVLMGAAQKHDLSAPLRDLPKTPVRALPAESDGDAGPNRPAPNAPDTVVQSTLASPAMPSTLKNFEGIDFPGVSCNCAPPDTNGEAGATQYVQIVNEGYQVWNKSTGASVLGPVGITTIWSGFGGVCQNAGDGDPVVLYDQFANRWLVSQFAGSGAPTDECIAISTTSDATSSYNRYDFHLGTNFFDYPHLSVWPDGYYMSMNVYNSAGTAFLGPEAFVFDRSAMLSGAAATFQTPSVALDPSADPFLPADIDGSALPPAGAPESFVSFPSGGGYLTHHYHVDWGTPANSTWTTFASPAAAGFSLLCPTTRNCVPQSGSSSNLNAIADRPMFRLAYRNFGDHESIVGNFTVSSGGVAGIRWFELRGVTSGPETVFQESTYQPDTTWRWMGSAAMDHNGDLAVGFSASSSSMFPSIRYAGRLAGDPLGTLGQGEAVLFAGLGSQFGTGNRWGDYSDLTIDPTDDCTFWYTTEYYPSGNVLTNQFNWRTRIGSFSFPGCGGGTTPVLTSITVSPATASVQTTGTQQFSATGLDQFGQPMSPQPTFTWSVTGGGTIDASGLFTAGGTPGGPFTVSAKSGGVTGTASVTVTSPPQPDFSFTVTPSSQSVKRGSTATYTITITQLNGFTGSITFSLSGQPSGSTGTFSPNGTSATSVTLTIQTPSTTAKKTYNLTVTGVSGSLTHTATAHLTVTR